MECSSKYMWDFLQLWKLLTDPVFSVSKKEFIYDRRILGLKVFLFILNNSALVHDQCFLAKLVTTTFFFWNGNERFQ